MGEYKECGGFIEVRKYRLVFRGIKKVRIYEVEDEERVLDICMGFFGVFE